MGDPLIGDFYRFEELLSQDERRILGRVREFLRTEVAPIANDYWARAEFPMELIKGYAELDIARLWYPQAGEPSPSSLLSGYLALEMARTDPSLATFYGVHTGLAMGSIAACGADEQRERWAPAIGR